MFETVAAAMAQAALLQAQTPAASREIYRHGLPDVNMHNWELTAAEVSYQPGGASARHRHPGITVVYVLEGAIRSQVGAGPEITYGPGQMFIELPGEIHAVSRNASATKPAKFLAIHLAEKGVPLTMQA